MTCLYGSQKQEGAQEFINPNDIGVLCALFGIEGALCRLLDLVPEAIKKIASLNPNVDNADDVFKDILKKVAETSFGLVVDAVTGQITTESFCAVAPPALPEDITYEDVFAFIAELVPILNYLFTANAILQGNSTNLLDKIVGFWLYQKWFENCECSPDPDGNPQPPEPELPPLFEKCGAGKFRARAGNSFGIVFANSAGVPIFINEAIVWETEFVIFESVGGRKNVSPPKIGNGDGEGVFTRGTLLFIVEEEDPFTWNTVNGVRVAAGTRPSYTIPPCEDYPIPELPTNFCELFPLDPLCFTPVNGCMDSTAVNYDPLANTDDGSCIYCEIAYVDVVEFVDCGQERQTKTVEYIESGTVKTLDVVEFVGCGQERQTKTVEYFDCEQ